MSESQVCHLYITAPTLDDALSAHVELQAHLEEFAKDKPYQLELMQLGVKDQRDKDIVEMAQDMAWVRDGEVEVDTPAIVSEGDDNGAYVSAWVYVSFRDTPLDKEAEEEDDEDPDDDNDET